MDSNNSKKKQKDPLEQAMTGYAIGISFILISAYLFWNGTYFDSKIATYIVGAFVGLFGVSSLSTEVDKSKKVTGVMELGFGAFFFVIWYVIYHFRSETLWVKIAIFALLILGAYALVLGLIKVFYSTIKSIKLDKNAKKSDIVKGITLLISQILGIALTALNILKVIGVLG